MKKVTLFATITALLIAVCVPSPARAVYVLPADRSVAFSAGIPGGIPVRPSAGKRTINVNDHGAVPNDGNSDSSAIAAAIAAATPGDVVSLGVGTYVISSTINLPTGVVLRGQGRTQTTVTTASTLSTMISASNGISSGSSGTQSPVVSGAIKGSTVLNLDTADADHASFNAGDVILVGMSSADVPWINVGNCSWDLITNQRDNSAVNYAQMVKVVSRNGGAVTISPAIMADMSSYNPFVARMGTGAFLRNVGVEKLKLTRSVYPSGQATMISYNGCEESWVSEVEVDHGWGRMIDFGRCFRSEMFKNYVHHGGVYSSGALNYHLVIRRYSGSNLIHNNVSGYTNKSMQIETTGGGNVIAYNYFDGSWVDESNKYWQGQDIGTHCAHPHHELVEGNIFNRFNNDAIHGSASHFILFRNAIDSDHEWVFEPSHAYDDTNSVAAVAFDLGYYGSVIGNVLGKAGRSNIYECNPSSSCVTGVGSNHIYMFRTGDNTAPSPYSTVLRHANYDYYNRAQIRNASDDMVMPDSLYLSSRPAWFGTLAWPPVNPNGPTVTDIPAKVFVATGAWPGDSYVAPVPKTGDLNGDGNVGVVDLAIFLFNWHSTARPAADLDQSGNVDATDLSMLLGNWG